MRHISIIFKRELAAYFNNPLAYVLIIIFSVLSMGLTFVIGPAVLAWVGTADNTAFWIVIGLLAAGTALMPLVPASRVVLSHCKLASECKPQIWLSSM
jgi:hypothetical protein